MEHEVVECRRWDLLWLQKYLFLFIRFPSCSKNGYDVNWPGVEVPANIEKPWNIIGIIWIIRGKVICSALLFSQKKETAPVWPNSMSAVSVTDEFLHWYSESENKSKIFRLWSITNMTRKQMKSVADEIQARHDHNTHRLNILFIKKLYFWECFTPFAANAIAITKEMCSSNE